MWIKAAASLLTLALQTKRAGPVFASVMNLKVKVIAAALLAGLLLTGCAPEESFPVPDVSGLESPVTLVRYDRALSALDTADLAAAVATLEDRYPVFTDVYLTDVLPLRRRLSDPEEQLLALRAFFAYPLVREIDSLVSARFTDADLAEQTARLEQALRYYRHYLPNAPRPDTLVTFYSQFEVAAALYGNGDLAAGLEFFLGPDYDYQRVSARDPIFSAYLARSYTPDHLTGKLMRVVIDDFVDPPRGGKLIDHLIYEGKKRFLLERVLPGVPAHVVHEVSPEQQAWLAENEIAIYAHLQKEKHLYATDPVLIRKYTQPAPSSQGMPAESPGQAVNFLGQRIVEAYVRNNPGVDMAALLAETDGQRILAGARYKPR